MACRWISSFSEFIVLLNYHTCPVRTAVFRNSHSQASRHHYRRIDLRIAPSMTALNLWWFCIACSRMPPHACQVLDQGEEPGPEDSLACRGKNLFRIVPYIPDEDEQDEQDEDEEEEEEEKDEDIKVRGSLF